jgi:hypothetical protein
MEKIDHLMAEKTIKRIKTAKEGMSKPKKYLKNNNITKKLFFK